MIENVVLILLAIAIIAISGLIGYTVGSMHADTQQFNQLELVQ